MLLGIKQERSERHWTQEQVAEQVGITKQAVNLLETAQIKPSFDVLVKLLYLFGKTEAAQTIVDLFTEIADTNQRSG